MGVRELFDFIFSEESELSADEFRDKLDSLSGYDLKNAHDLIDILGKIERRAHSLGCEKGASDFKEWIISKYPVMREFFAKETNQC